MSNLGTMMEYGHGIMFHEFQSLACCSANGAKISNMSTERTVTSVRPCGYRVRIVLLPMPFGPFGQTMSYYVILTIPNLTKGSKGSTLT